MFKICRLGQKSVTNFEFKRKLCLEGKRYECKVRIRQTQGNREDSLERCFEYKIELVGNSVEVSTVILRRRRVCRVVVPNFLQ